MGLKEKCSVCGGNMEQKYLPMKEWNMEGQMCGKCYSKKIAEHYPGEHVRVDLSKND